MVRNVQGSSYWMKRLLGYGAGSLLAVSTAVVTYNEGYKEVAYRDTANVWTICYGETAGVKPGQVATKTQCDAQLTKSLELHGGVLDDLPKDIPPAVALGSLDMAYNIGVSGFNNSTVKKWILLRDYKRAGEAVLSWRYITRNGKKYDCSQLVNGKPNKICWGLWQRRQWEAKAIGNQYKTPEEAVEALKAVK